MKSKTAGIILIIGSLWYMIAETICAFTFHDTLAHTYLAYTISTLGIPNSNSPYFFLMNSAFILLGLIILFSNFYIFKDYIIKHKIIYYIFTLICGIGLIIVGLIHAKSSFTSYYHILGANMTIFGGNILLLIISKSMDKFKSYQKITLVLGIIGLIGYVLLFFNTKYLYRPVFERLSIYTLILWSFITGVYLRSI